MKKILALVLVLCMMAAALPVLAESGDESGSGLSGLLSGLMGGEGEFSSLLKILSGLKTRLQGNKAILSGIVSMLKPKLESLLGGSGEGSEGGLGSILSGLTDKLGGGELNLDSLLGGLLGGGDAGMSEEEAAEYAKELEAHNQEVLADTGDSVPNRKIAESLDEFYGSWTYTKFVTPESELEMNDSGIGLVFGENTFYYTIDGELSSDTGLPPEVTEMKLDSGLLKLLINELWTEYALTQDGQLVEITGESMSYYVRAAE